jgi:hypothetical protein
MHLSGSRRLATWGLLLIFSGSLALPAISIRHTTPDVDDRVLSGYGRRAALATPDDVSDAGDHCAVCHWLLAISGATAQAPLTIAAAASPATPAVSRPIARLGRSEVPAIPSRAPPARFA